MNEHESKDPEPIGMKETNPNDAESNGIQETDPRKGSHENAGGFKVIKEVVKHPLDPRNRIVKGMLYFLAAIGLGTVTVVTAMLISPGLAEKLYVRNQLEVAHGSTSAVATSKQTNADEKEAKNSNAKDADRSNANTGNDTDTTQQGATEQGAAQQNTGALTDAELGEIVRKGERSVVQVSGISSEMDYFNQSYENEHQAVGLLIASSEADYYVLTETRIVREAQTIRVRFYDESVSEATLYKEDANTGFAIIKIVKSTVPNATRVNMRLPDMGNSNMLTRGETVVAIGNPLGFSDSVVIGHIASLDNIQTVFDGKYNIITTDIQGNSSGSGILMNWEGEVVAVISQRIGNANQSVLTAYGSSQINPLISRMANNGTRAFIGLEGRDVDTSISNNTGIPEGMLITQVKVDSPAMHSGIKNMDVVTAVNGTAIRTVSDYLTVLLGLKEGGKVDVIVMRKGSDKYEKLTFQVTVGAE